MPIEISAFGPTLKASLYLPARGGAWTLHLEAAEPAPDAATPEVGDVVTLDAPALTGRVVRVGLAPDRRLKAFIAGGTVDWSAPVELRHARETTTGAELASLGVGAAAGGLSADLPFWSRPATTVGDAVRALAEAAGASGWRTAPDGAALLVDPAATPESVEPGGVEVDRDPARGLVTLAPDELVVLPGVQVADDLVGDVVYDVDGDSPLRCRYYLAAARGRADSALERLVRALVAREMLYRGAYTAVVQSQSGDLSTVDVLPDDSRLAGAGLSAVPLRQGLPGTLASVAPGERVLLAWEGGDPRRPYAAVWHGGAAGALSVQVGGVEPVALAALVSARLDAIQATFDAHTHPYVDTPAGPAVTSATLTLVGPLAPVASEVLASR